MRLSGCMNHAEKAGVDPGSVVDWSAILDADLASGDLDFNLS